MMTGQGPYGALEMGGMFTTVKVRRGLARDDFRDPGWFRQPPGTQAYEWTGAPLAATRAPAPAASGDSAAPVLNVRKGSTHHGH
jgi:hypothetical protein